MAANYAGISTSTIGNGTGPYATDIVVKDLDLDVSNRVKDTHPYSICV